MSKDKLFAYYLSKNPAMLEQLENGRVTLTASGFKKFFNTTYDEGYKEGINQDLDICEDNECEQNNGSSLNDLLNLFGMR